MPLNSPIQEKQEHDASISFLQHTVHSLYRPLINSDIASLQTQLQERDDVIVRMSEELQEAEIAA